MSDCGLSGSLYVAYWKTYRDTESAGNAGQRSSCQQLDEIRAHEKAGQSGLPRCCSSASVDANTLNGSQPRRPWLLPPSIME